MENQLRIVLLANDGVGLKIAGYLKKNKENIVALVLHPKKNAKKSVEIARIVGIKNIFYANQIKNPHYLKKIMDLKPDMAISGWFGYILKKEFIKIFPRGVVNLHNSYLPYNRGKYPHVWAIYNGSKYGAAIHYITEKTDAGPIIAQKEIKIKTTDIAGTLYERSLKEVVKLFEKTWPKIISGKIDIKRQNAKIATSHLAKEVKKLDIIDLNKKYLGRDLINTLRARSFADRAYAYFLHKRKRIYIKINFSNKLKF